MRIHGYRRKCRKVKRVAVTSHYTGRNLALGIFDDCAETDSSNSRFPGRAARSSLSGAS